MKRKKMIGKNHTFPILIIVIEICQAYPACSPHIFKPALWRLDQPVLAEYYDLQVKELLLQPVCGSDDDSGLQVRGNNYAFCQSSNR